MTWINEILRCHEEVETPQSFWYWSALAAISAIVKDNVWLNRGGLYKLYPNIYVMLHADTGMKKGPPVNFAKDLVKRVNNTRIIYGRSSIQGILKELGTPAFTQPGGKIVNQKSVGVYFASEFSASMVEDRAAMRILTDLYDRHYNEGDWKQLLKMEQFILKDPMLCLLVATNAAMMKGMMHESEIHGGFFARMFVIYESEEQSINSLIRPLKHPPDMPGLAEYLKEISNLSGDFYPSLYKDDDLTPVGRMYDEWYTDLRLNLRQKEIKDPIGTTNRIGDHVLKIAMLLSLAKKPAIEISEETMHEAIHEGEKLIGNVRRANVSGGSDEKFADQKAIIIKELVYRDNHMISRAQLMRKYTYYFNASELDEILLSLEQAGTIRLEVQGNQQIIVMPGNVAHEYLLYFEGRKK